MYSFFPIKTLTSGRYRLALIIPGIRNRLLYGRYSIDTSRVSSVATKNDLKKSMATDAIEIIDLSAHRPRKVPGLTWRNCIKKIYEIDPLCCPQCGGEMRIISFIHQFSVVRKILEHLGLWDEDHSRGPPQNEKLVYESLDDGWFREFIDEATTVISF